MAHQQPIGSRISANAELTLADLNPGDSGEVTGYRLVHEPLTQRLMQLGVLRGRTLKIIRRAPAGDPIEVRLAGSSLLLRHAEAARIEVRRN